MTWCRWLLTGELVFMEVPTASECGQAEAMPSTQLYRYLYDT